MPLRYELVTGTDVFFTGAENYTGLLETKPFRREGRMVVIPPRAAVQSTDYLCDELMQFYEAAAATPKALLLDVVSPRVRAPGNNRDRSKLIKKYLESKPDLPRVCFMVVSGGSISVLKPESNEFEDHSLRELKVGKVLETLDKKMPATPIFVLGYTKMERSISYVDIQICGLGSVHSLISTD
jgi:hypothetical protein